MRRDITKLNDAVEGIVAERKSRLRRYVSAKQHCKKLQTVARKLDEARGNYTVRYFGPVLRASSADASSTPGGCSHVERYDNRQCERACTSVHAPDGHNSNVCTRNAARGWHCVPIQCGARRGGLSVLIGAVRPGWRGISFGERIALEMLSICYLSACI